MVVARVGCSVFKSVVDAVSKIVNNVVVDFNESGMTLQAMDSCHVSLCFLHLKSTGFIGYRCEKNISIGISLLEMSKIFKCSAKSDDLELELQDDKKIKISIVKASRTLEFEMKAMDIEADIFQIPETEPECVITMSSSEFKSVANDIGIMGESCIIKVDSEGMTFSSENDGGVIRFNDTEASGITTTGTTNGKFANKYIQLFTKASALNKNVSLKLSDGQPICVEYIIDDLGVLKYYLAPKTDDE